MDCRLGLISLGLSLALSSGCAAAGLAELYRSTARHSDSLTNLDLLDPFPPPSKIGLTLSPEVAAWAARAAATDAHPFVLGEPPSPEVAAAERAITEWQREIGSRGDEALERLWPDLPPSDVTQLKLAIERGDDRYTMLYLVHRDLRSDAARAWLLARIDAKARQSRPAGAAARFTIINTDVDDTTLANLWDRGRYARGTVYPGYPELLAAQGSFLVILTARPAVGGMLSELTQRKFYALLHADRAEPARINVSVAPGELPDVFDSLAMGLVKAESLVLERWLFPEADSVFNGDSGQGDWITALILRQLDPEGFPYATVHDVRPWSPEHRDAMLAAVAASTRLERLYRRALGLGEGPLQGERRARLDAALARIRDDVARALSGPHGRLDGTFLKSRKIVLYRNPIDLAYELASMHRITLEQADRIAAVAAPALRFLGDNPFDFDAGDPERLAQRLADRAAAAAASARVPPAPARANP